MSIDPAAPAPGPGTIMQGKGFIASCNRVAEYVRQFKRLRDTGGTIHRVHTDPEGSQIELSVDDLEAVLMRALPVTMPDREALAFTLFAADNYLETPEQIRADYARLRAEQAAAGEHFYVDLLADAAIAEFRRLNRRGSA